MYCRGTTPPLIWLMKEKPEPDATGSRRIFTCP